MKYLLPWTDENGDQKLYHWNLDGGTSTWELPDGWTNLANVVMYELSDQGRINEKTVAVSNGTVTLDAKAATAYVLVKGESSKTLKVDYGEDNYVVDRDSMVTQEQTVHWMLLTGVGTLTMQQ